MTTFLDIINCGVDDGCHDNATCNDANGNYTCACDEGFTGDGFNCTGETVRHNVFGLHWPFLSKWFHSMRLVELL